MTLHTHWAALEFNYLVNTDFFFSQGNDTEFHQFSNTQLKLWSYTYIVYKCIVSIAYTVPA